MYILGFDIGGTKCAAITARWENEKIELMERVSCPTEHCPPEEMLKKLEAITKEINLVLTASIPVEECPEGIKAYA